MAIQEVIIGRLLGEALKSALKAAFRPNNNDDLISMLENSIRAEISWESNFLDELFDGSKFKLNTNLSIKNRAHISQSCDIQFSLSPIDGALHGPLNSVYKKAGAGAIPTQVIAPGEGFNVSLDDSISLARSKPIIFLETSESIFNYTDERLVSLSNGALITPSELTLNAPETGNYSGVGVSVCITNFVGELTIRRYAYGGLATLDDVENLNVLVSSSENSFFKFMDGLIPFCQMFIFRNGNSEQGQWLPTTSLGCFYQDNSSLVSSASKTGASVSIPTIYGTDSIIELKNFARLLMVFRKNGNIEYDAKI